MRAGICTSIWKGFEFHFDVEWMKTHRVRGIVIGRHIMFSVPAEDLDRWIFRHELEHAYQQIREGVILFYLKYFLYSLRYGYNRNPFEVEARDRQYDELTENEAELLWKLKENSLRRSTA
jgi:hypothetical protein